MRLSVPELKRGLVLQLDLDEVRRDADPGDLVRGGEVEALVEEQAERRLRQRPDVVGLQLLVEDEHRLAVGDDADRRRRVVLEAHAARPGDVEFALQLLAVRVELDELAVHRVDGRELRRNLGEHAALFLGQRDAPARRKRAAASAAASTARRLRARRMAPPESPWRT